VRVILFWTALGLMPVVGEAGGPRFPLRFTTSGVSAVAMVLAVLSVARDSTRAPGTAAPGDVLLGGEMQARTLMLYDGTPASRFDPVSEHAAVYNPDLPKQDAYHVARLTGVDTDGSPRLCGRAEVRRDNKWGSICFRGFTQTDAHMFCKTMGLTGGSARYSDGLKDTWDDTAITHRDLTDVSQRAEYGRGKASNPPLQDDVPVIWMTEVQCAGNEANILDCPFGGKPGEGARVFACVLMCAPFPPPSSPSVRAVGAAAMLFLPKMCSERRCDPDVRARRQLGRECAQRLARLQQPGIQLRQEQPSGPVL
jgi:hypothetical protein